MATVTIFVGSARKRHTHHAANRFAEELGRLGGVTCEVVMLSDLEIGVCRGCCVCFLQGEEHCPLKDDRDAVFERIAASDGVVFATPVYSFQVSALLKRVLDRMGFMFHRPRYFGKTFTNIVVQGIWGGDKVVDYLDFVGDGLGFTTVKGIVVKSLEPLTPRQEADNDRRIADLARRFHRRIVDRTLPSPSLFQMMKFRMSRSSIRVMLDEGALDWRYYRDHGWFESGYFTDVRLGVFKRAVGWILDAVAVRMATR